MGSNNKKLHDLISPEGYVVDIQRVSSQEYLIEIFVENIQREFAGFYIENKNVIFNLKSSLAQLGIDSKMRFCSLNIKKSSANLHITLKGYGKIAKAMLLHIDKGMYIGKLFAEDKNRLVRSSHELLSIYKKKDVFGDLLLSLGNDNEKLLLCEEQKYVVAKINVIKGFVKYKEGIYDFLPTISLALKHQCSVRKLIALYQEFVPEKHLSNDDDILLLKTAPLHVRTVFAQVAESHLPQGIYHTSASILQPDTVGSGNIYEFFGSSKKYISSIPLRFYRLEPYRSHYSFHNNSKLKNLLKNSKVLFDAFETVPKDEKLGASTFITDDDQLKTLRENSWKVGKIQKKDPSPELPFIHDMINGTIVSEGVLFSKYFPKPQLKKFFLNDCVQKYIRELYFYLPAFRRGNFFTWEDRALLIDLYNHNISVYWVDQTTTKILKYVQRRGKDSGMFVPTNKVKTFFNATFFGIYGSNLLQGLFKDELFKLMQGIIEIKKIATHPLMNKKKSLALVTGGGPGVMEVGNLVARELDILSCANIVDFSPKNGTFINEQIQNPYVEAKMIYNLNNLVERQAEFNLDFPIFLTGGIGTDFELLLEEVSRKVGVIDPHPVLLFGSQEYWEDKISHRFNNNLRHGTIVGSEWMSNCFYCVQNAEQGMFVYKMFFDNKLPIGKKGPMYKRGFVVVSKNASSLH